MSRSSRNLKTILGQATILGSILVLPGLAWGASNPATAASNSAQTTVIQLAENRNQQVPPPTQNHGQQGQHGMRVQGGGVRNTAPSAWQRNNAPQQGQPRYVQQPRNAQPLQRHYVQQPQQPHVWPQQPHYTQQRQQPQGWKQQPHHAQQPQGHYLQPSQRNSVQQPQRHYVEQSNNSSRYWTHQTQRYDWHTYRQGQRPPQWQQYHRDFDARVYEHNWYAQQRYHWEPYRQPPGWYYRRWVYGQVFPVTFWTPNYWITDYWNFGLPNPPYGYVWVRYASDALLVNVQSGAILTVVYGQFA